MARVIPDLIDGEVRRAAAGDTVRRLFRVSELTGGASGRLVKATEASGIPRVGDFHPVLNSLACTEVRAIAAAGEPEQAVVEAVYSVPGSTAGGAAGNDAEVSIASDLITEETVRDINGDLITTSYTYQLKIDGNPGGGFVPFIGGMSASITNSTVHRIEVQRPTFSITYVRGEGRAPLAKAFNYAGKVNSSNFLGRPADYWLCNVESNQDTAENHRVRYRFTLNQNGWQARISHSLNGTIPTAVSAANGEKLVQVYARADFNGLRLPSI